MINKHEKTDWIYGAENLDAIAERYSQWAKNYDRDLAQEFGYVGPQRGSEVFLRYVTKDAMVLDAGVGTGLVGELLASHGYNSLVGIDISEGMLAQARLKGVYQELSRKVLGEPLGFENDSFDAVIAIGVFAPAQGPCEAFDELIRVTKPGGHIVFTIRPDFHEQSDFKKKQADLESAGKWQLLERGEDFQGLPVGEPELIYNIWVYRVC